MKPNNAFRASQLVNHADKLEHSAKLLLGDDAGEMVKVKIESTGYGRLITEAELPPTYIANALKSYREAVIIEAQALGVEYNL